MSLPLEGIRVLDLTQFGPGPYTTMILGDFGADIIRIEQPGKKEAGQTGDKEGKWSLDRIAIVGYEAFNRNKRSIILNLRSEDSRDVFYRLAKSADVIVEGFRPGVVKRLGVDYDTIREFNTRIIYCSMSGYGQDGPYVAMPGHDVNYISMAGLLSMIGIQNGPPVIPMNLLADWAGAAHHAVMGILMAIIARARDNVGQYVDISYLDTTISLIGFIVYDSLNFGTPYKRGETPFNGGLPGYNVYPTKDGKYISIGCLEPHFWENLCRFLGREDYAQYYVTEGPMRNEIIGFLEDTFSTRTRDEWFSLLKDENIPVGPVYDIEEVCQDPQVVHRGMLIEVEHPKRGRAKQVGIPIRLSRTPGVVRSPAPTPGEHTKDILMEIGYTKKQIDNMAGCGAIVLS